MAVDDNRVVEAGDLLVALDDRDYRTAVASAEANRDRDGAMLDDAVATVERQGTAIAQAEAQLDSASAQVALTQSDADRSEQLASTGFGTVKTREQADTALLQAKSSLANARASSNRQPRSSRWRKRRRARREPPSRPTGRRSTKPG